MWKLLLFATPTPSFCDHITRIYMHLTYKYGHPILAQTHKTVVRHSGKVSGLFLCCGSPGNDAGLCLSCDGGTGWSG